MKDFPIPFPIQKGQKITLFTINGIAATSRVEILITGEQQGRHTFKEKGKRKEYYLKIRPDDIILDGWDLPLRADSESNRFCSNACFNIAANSKDELKQWLDKSLNPLTDDTKAKVMFISMEDFRNGNTANEDLLYPEIETHHAVVNRVKAKASLNKAE